MKRGHPVTMPQLLLLAGVSAHDPTTPPAGRRNAQRVLDVLLSLAASHGFVDCDRLRTLLQVQQHASPEATRLAHAALESVPGDAIQAAFDRAGLSGLIRRSA
ncbi:hypothetical protein AWB67_00970 [Caballeronia terrestris]|uniref:Uncharacterized protein n=1 Tax=Caballeronia terrestris TaxID=1226301 RepID=A0A158FZ55_9BURK|nr:hypothetical protein [Caballeronia terrestris]SAL24917.1 hypothetical protein AWB67_00970 [Caballeronia terrestris]